MSSHTSPDRSYRRSLSAKSLISSTSQRSSARIIFKKIYQAEKVAVAHLTAPRLKIIQIYADKWNISITRWKAERDR